MVHLKEQPHICDDKKPYLSKRTSVLLLVLELETEYDFFHELSYGIFDNCSYFASFLCMRVIRLYCF